MNEQRNGDEKVKNVNWTSLGQNHLWNVSQIIEDRKLTITMENSSDIMTCVIFEIKSTSDGVRDHNYMVSDGPAQICSNVQMCFISLP